MTCPDRPAAAPAKPPHTAQWMTGPHQQHANDSTREGEGGSEECQKEEEWGKQTKKKNIQTE